MVAGNKVAVAVGSYTEPVPHCPLARGVGVSIFQLDLVTGGLALERTIPTEVCGPNPSYLGGVRGVLLVANEVEDLARATVRAIGGIASEPHLLASAPVGKAACHICVLDQHVMIANYGDGSVVGFELGQQGVELRRVLSASLGAGITFPGTVSNRQEAAHAHAVIAAGPEAILVSDLGSNCLWRLMRDGTGSSWSTSLAFAAQPGAGPRHAVLHPVLPQFLYVLNELSGSVTGLFQGGSIRGSSAASVSPLLRRLQEDVPLHPELSGRHGAAGAAIRAHPNGRWLYASLRAGQASCITLFDIDGASGRLTRRGSVNTHATPRDFALVVDVGHQGAASAAYAVVANQDADSLLVFRVATDGTLEPLPQEPTACASPICVLPLASSRRGAA